MKNHVVEFLRRGVVAFGFGPIVLAVIYLVLHKAIGLNTVSVGEVCLGILSLSLLAFIAGGMNFIYQIERIPLMVAILIHGVVLYLTYLGTYVVNGWLDQGLTPFFVFTAIFVLGYLAIWAVIYFVTSHNTTKLNKKLLEKQKEV